MLMDFEGLNQGCRHSLDDFSEWCRFSPAFYEKLALSDGGGLSKEEHKLDLAEDVQPYRLSAELILLHFEASQLLFQKHRQFFAIPESEKTPFIVGITGARGVGKTVAAKALKEVLSSKEPSLDVVVLSDRQLPSRSSCSEHFAHQPRPPWDGRLRGCCSAGAA